MAGNAKQIKRKVKEAHSSQTGDVPGLKILTLLTVGGSPQFRPIRWEKPTTHGSGSNFTLVCRGEVPGTMYQIYIKYYHREKKYSLVNGYAESRPFDTEREVKAHAETFSAWSILGSLFLKTGEKT